MGSETRCTVRHGRTTADVKVLLESAEILVRGELKLAIPFRSMTDVRVRDGRLTIVWPEGTTVFELGPAAAKWAEKIRNPKRLIDKLGVKPGQRVSVTGIDDADFLEQLAERAPGASVGRIAKHSAAVFLGVETVADLARIAKAADLIARDGMIWVVWPKGRPALKEDHVRAASLRAGLVDVKVAAFSATLSALKLVIPIARR